MIIITQYWRFGNIKVKKNILNTLLLYCSDINVEKIIIYVENDTSLKLTHSKIEKRRVVKRLTYDEIIGDMQLNNGLVCIVNVDTYIDTISVKNNINNYRSDILCYNEKYVLINGKFDNIHKSNILLGKSIQYDNITSPNILKIDLYGNINTTPATYNDESYINIIDKSIKLSYKKNKLSINNKLAKNNKKINTANITQKSSNILVNKVISTAENSQKNTNILHGSVLIHIHLYYHDMLDYFLQKLNVISKFNIDVHFTVNDDVLPDQLSFIKNIIEKNGYHVHVYDNKGMDIGPFILLLNDIANKNYTYDYVLKLHSKKSLSSDSTGVLGKDWLNNLVDPLISTSDIFSSNLVKLNTDKVGMIGAKKWISEYVSNNALHINELSNILSINNTGEFIAGTMFMSRYDILMKYVDKLFLIYNKLENGYVTDDVSGTYVHSMERILGYLISSNDLKIIGV